MMTETISAGGEILKTVWLRARVKASRKPDVYIVQFVVPGLVEAPTFYVDPAIVRVGPLQAGEEADGQVQALLVESRGGKLVVDILGEAVSYGPRLVIPEELAE